MFGSDLFLLLFLFGFFYCFRDHFGSGYFYLPFFGLISVKSWVFSLLYFFLFLRWYLDAPREFKLDFFCEKGFVLLDNGGFVIYMSVIGGDDASFLEILQGSAVSTLFHKKQLFAIPGIEVDGFDKGIDDSVLTMLAGAVETQVNAEMDGGPFGIFLFAIETNLICIRRTLLSLMFLIWANTLSRVSSSTIYLDWDLPARGTCLPSLSEIINAVYVC